MTDLRDRPDAPLVDRADELVGFDGLLDGAQRGDSRLVVVEGPAGIGKSRLLAELRERAATRGMQVLSAQGSELERDFPYGVVRQLFDLLVAGPRAAELLEGAAAGARSVFAAIPEGPAGEEDISFAALHGLYWLTVNAAGDAPLMLVVDDVHWCDRPSLRLLAYLSRRLDGLGGTLVLGLRTAEPGVDPVLLGDLVAQPDAQHVTPGPLSRAGVGELIAARLDDTPDEAFTDACLDATGGNPLLLRQLLSSLEADGVRPRAAEADAVARVGPRAVSRTVLLRLRRLPAPAAAVARAVAVLGSGADLPLVSALAEVDELSVVRSTAALARAEILLPEQPLAFVHPLVRDAVYHELPSAERELWHARAAQLLAAASRSSEAVATQLVAAPRRGQEWVVDRLMEAARLARHKGAAESAVTYLQRALAEPPPEERLTEVTLELALAETLTSGPAAAEHLRAAHARITDPAHRAQVAGALARTLLFTAPAAEAIAVLEAAAAELPAEFVDEHQALRALGLMAVFFGAGEQAELTRLEDEEIVGDGPGAKMLAAIVGFVRAITGSHVDDCVPLARRALADDTLIRVDPGLFPVAAISVLVFADQDDALTAWEELRQLAYEGGSLLGVLTVGLWRGLTLLWRGELRDAAESLANVRDDFLSWGLVRSADTYVPAFYGMTLLARGDLPAARKLLEQAVLSEERTDGDRHLLRAQGTLLVAEGRFEEALAVTDDMRSRLTFITLPAWSGWQELRARALHGLGRTDEALALAQESVERARLFGADGMVGRSLALLGTLEGEDGIPRLQEAVAHLERATTKLDLARTLLALGAALRRARRPTEAREPLLRALELGDRLGADGVVEQARAELRAAGVRPRTTALRGLGALTASERRVADLAASGRSNKEIAQTLYVTPKTVEVHLSSAYRKLEIRSRRELEHALSA